MSFELLDPSPQAKTAAMTVQDVIDIRKRAGLSQKEMGERIGLSMRALQDIETGKSQLRPLHVLAVERVALDLALDRQDPMLAPTLVRRAALDFAYMIRGD